LQVNNQNCNIGSEKVLLKGPQDR